MSQEWLVIWYRKVQEVDTRARRLGYTLPNRLCTYGGGEADCRRFYEKMLQNHEVLAMELQDGNAATVARHDLILNCIGEDGAINLRELRDTVAMPDNQEEP